MTIIINPDQVHQLETWAKSRKMDASFLLAEIIGDYLTNRNVMPRSRDEAIYLRVPFYHTGRPCKYGHISKRYASSYACFKCLKSSK